MWEHSTCKTKSKTTALIAWKCPGSWQLACSNQKSSLSHGHPNGQAKSKSFIPSAVLDERTFAHPICRWEYLNMFICLLPYVLGKWTQISSKTLENVLISCFFANKLQINPSLQTCKHDTIVEGQLFSTSEHKPVRGNIHRAPSFVHLTLFSILTHSTRWKHWASLSSIFQDCNHWHNSSHFLLMLSKSNA